MFLLNKLNIWYFIKYMNCWLLLSIDLEGTRSKCSKIYI